MLLIVTVRRDLQVGWPIVPLVAVQVVQDHTIRYLSEEVLPDKTSGPGVLPLTVYDGTHLQVLIHSGVMFCPPALYLDDLRSMPTTPTPHCHAPNPPLVINLQFARLHQSDHAPFSLPMVGGYWRYCFPLMAGPWMTLPFTSCCL